MVPWLWFAVGVAAGLLDYGFGVGFGLVASLVLSGVLGVDPRSVAGAAAVAQLASGLPAVVLHRRVGGSLDPGGAYRALGIGLASSLGGLSLSVLLAGAGGSSVRTAYGLGLLATSLAFYLASRVNGGGSGAYALLLGFAAGAVKAAVGGGYSGFLILAQRVSGTGFRDAVALNPLAKLPAFLVVGLVYGLAGFVDLGAALALTVGGLASTPLAARLLSRVGGPRVFKAVSLVTGATGTLLLAVWWLGLG